MGVIVCVESGGSTNPMIIPTSILRAALRPAADVPTVMSWVDNQGDRLVP